MNTSVRRSMGSLPACSGDMYAYLPFTWPTLVRCRFEAALATPKSRIFTDPS
nr:hypothetical protein [Sorangium cellulosum]